MDDRDPRCVSKLGLLDSVGIVQHSDQSDTRGCLHLRFEGQAETLTVACHFRGFYCFRSGYASPGLLSPKDRHGIIFFLPPSASFNVPPVSQLGSSAAACPLCRPPPFKSPPPPPPYTGHLPPPPLVKSRPPPLRPGSCLRHSPLRPIPSMWDEVRRQLEVKYCL